MIDWTQPLRTKGGAIGILQPATAIEHRRRVLMCRDESRPSTDPKEQTKPGKETTTWLYPEDGIGRCDRLPSDMDLVNA